MAETTPKIGPGYVVDGRYRLREKLGEGGMGSVWKAEHLSLKSDVAVKFIIKNVEDDEQSSARFMLEAQAAAGLHSTHVVKMLDYGVFDKRPYIVMELLRGESLDARLRRNGPLTPGQTAEMLQQVARAISKAHDAGIIHRDLKPDNIFLVDEGDIEVVKVLDFGVAKQIHQDLTESSPRTVTGALMGTPFYMSPEQLGAGGEIGVRSDVWALGVIVYECLLGTRPFTADTLPEMVLAVAVGEKPVPSEQGVVPAGFDEWFDKATARVVDERFGSVLELTAHLFEIVEGPRSLRAQQLRRGAIPSTGDDFATAATVEQHPSESPSPSNELSGSHKRAITVSAAGSEESGERGSLPATTAKSFSTAASPSTSPPGGRRMPWGLIAAVVIACAAAIVLLVRQKEEPATTEPAPAAAAEAREPASVLVDKTPVTFDEVADLEVPAKSTDGGSDTEATVQPKKKPAAAAQAPPSKPTSRPETKAKKPKIDLGL